ncbi:peptidase domain-containing ABC transporter [Dysgonomonas sp. 25]|uniref:peptidase domain-containing ABC transporter n=1 Tax=Dysgonomonas sp. 25 TaxID=2302933 RepID=UPI0013D52A89|nr:peptidase domain-containing ABC transporter [Dysgonomonas sp. 25]NDV68611.1 peptidase domain-containing ABC transporter [Dysgonomonas sp. 25]
MGIKIKQRDITDCGAACLASVAEHYKLKMPVSKIRQIAGTDRKGTTIKGMIQAAEKLGFEAKAFEGKIDFLSEMPLPAIAHVIVRDMLRHYVVIYKVSQKNITYLDPEDGKIHTLPINEFEKIWTGVLILLIPSEDFQAKDEKISNISRFFFLLKPHKSILIQCLVGAILYTVLGLSTSIYIGKITDYVLVGGNTNLLNLMSIGMIVILLLRVFLGVAQTVFMLNTGQQIDARLILGYYKHLLKLPQQFFDSMRVGEILSRVNDAVKIRAFINGTSISLIVNIFILIFSFILMFVYSWKLALMILITVPLYLAIYLAVNKLNKKYERKVMEDSADLESQLVESLNSVRTIKQFGIEDFENLKTENRFIQLLRTVYRSAINSIFSSESSGLVSSVFTIVLLWVGSYLVLDNEITAGTLLSFYAIIGYFTSPVLSLIGANKTIQNAVIAADRLFEIMDLERESDENKMDFAKHLNGDIRFEKISFSYGARAKVFKNFSLQIPQGKVTAIIGESGSGKTTLAVLLQKLYTLNAGKIYIGEHNLDYFSNSSMRENVATVPQQLDLFSGTIIENIALGEYSPDMERIVTICKELGIISFIEKLPSGFQTYVGEHGVGLSGGEKQRIAIARALYRNPEILILDEATSSLDSQSEHDVQQAIYNFNKQGKTVIIIAHRLSTVMSADKIVILEKGTLIEEGTHAELYTEGTRYYAMWQKQIPILE